MPRIDPVQLLNCLSVLLSPSGGIKSRDEVQRLAHLMTKFSKKLVSKCIYIQILKCTESELLGLFLGSGGWRLAHVWLTESIAAKNWPLVRELLELLLLCPVDIELLKTNNCPKLVKELSKDGNDFAIRALASKLVDQWLKTVKGEQFVPILESDIKQIIANAQKELDIECKKEDKSEVDVDKKIKSETEPSDNKQNDTQIKNEQPKETEPLPVIKISMKDGAQIVSQMDDDDDKQVEKSHDKEKPRDKSKSKSKDKSHERSSSSSKSSSSKSSSKSSSDDKHKSISHKSSSPSKHSSSSKDKPKDKDRHSSSSKSKDSIKRSSEKSSSSSKYKDDKSSKSSSDKDKSKDKPKDEKTGKKHEDEKPSIHKLGKIPKLSDSKKDKPTISIEVRKPDEPKPKTVKTFNSKFRKHGLEEETRPPPSRAAILSKKPPPAPHPPPAKRVSDVALHDTPPEKKPKPEPVEKPGSIKLIPPKPKPMLLLESDMFMDALTASAPAKKDPKKRKRRTSGSKDGPPSPPHTSPPAETKSVPPRFYQDTLETDDKEKSPKSPEKDDEVKASPKEEAPQSPVPETSHTVNINGLKGVLCYHKRKGPKKSIKWKPDTELEEIQYFELDETERVNVTKTFTDMKHLERIHERESFQKARNLSVDDVMEEKTSWRPLMLVEATGQVEVEWGKKSKERDIQAAKQKGTLQPLYFSKAMIPDSPLEPDMETHTYTEPTIIPLEDVTGNQDNVSDFRNMPWPEPKGNAPPPSSQPAPSPNMFPGQFPNGFPPVPAQFPPGMPGFPPGTAMMPPDWVMPGVPVPGMMMPPDVMMPGADMFPPGGMFPMPGMFPPDFGMAQGPPGPAQDGFNGPENFPSPPGNFRGNMRGRGGGWRGKQGRGGGGPQRGGGKKPCIYFQRKGSCRQGDKCTFLHPGVNGPY